MITEKAVRELSKWYEAHEEADDAISPLIGFLVMACIDAGYDKEYALEMFDTCWDAAEKRIDKWDAEH